MTLWLRGSRLKTWTKPVPKLFRVLATFEKQGWPQRIEVELMHRRQLVDALRQLKIALKNTPLLLDYDESRRGVTWQMFQA
jgi:hypothetical protein